MFCVKCGEDIGKFRFCPHCGTQVPETEEVVWSVGMACPHCGGTKLEGNCCAFCGSQLIVGEDAKMLTELPLGAYYGSDAQMVILKEDHIVMRHDRLVRIVEERIPYDQIRHVLLVGLRRKMGVVLMIRWEGSGDGPLPTNWWGYARELNSVQVFRENVQLFHRVFRFLQTRAPKDAKFSILDGYRK